MQDLSYEAEFSYYASLWQWSKVFKALQIVEIDKAPITMSNWLSVLEGVGLTLLVKGEIQKFFSTVFGKSAEEISRILSNEIKLFSTERTANTFLKIYLKFREAGVDPTIVPLNNRYWRT